MLEDTPDQDPTTGNGSPTAPEAGQEPTATARDAEAPAEKAAKKAARRTPAKKTAVPDPGAPATEPAVGTAAAEAPAKTAATTAAKKAAKKTAKKAPAKKAATAKKAAKKAAPDPAPEPVTEQAAEGSTEATAPMPLFQAPETVTPPAKKAAKKTTKTAKKTAKKTAEGAPKESAASDDAGSDAAAGSAVTSEADVAGDSDGSSDEGSGRTEGDEEPTGRRKRRRGGRRRRKSSGESGDDGGSGADAPAGSSATDEADKPDAGQDGDHEPDEGSTSSRRRRRRRRAGEDGGGQAAEDPKNTVTKVRKKRSAEDQITAVSGSTRLEAKKQRRREGREAGRRRAPIVSEAEFLARRESVERVMAIRQRDDLTQIAVLEDKVLVEHYVARESQTSLIGNVYLGRVQNVLPSMEAAFIDIGKGRNAVLYAGEVNWTALGHKEGQPRKIESVLSSGQQVMVQVTKDPLGHKGARLTSQISLAGRFLVYVPDGTNSGISRKLPDTERSRLKALLKEIVPAEAGVIVRTAAEGASEEELTRDVERLTARWSDIEKQAAKGSGPQLLYGEPDLMLKVVRDLFTEDFATLAVQGADAWDTVQGYVSHVAPDLEERLQRHDPDQDGAVDLFATYRIDEQIAKGLDRKVWLPSGGSLIIDRTEAMTVVDVNTGKFTGSGGNLEETVTKNNLEAAEEMVRQLRLRDIGGIIVIDFIDMVLESNRDLVLRRLVECLGRDRTRHQVAEVTSLGLVQMTRKRIGTGLLEAFSESCTHCGGRGLILSDVPVEQRAASEQEPRRGRRSRGGRGRGGENGGGQEQAQSPSKPPSPKDVAAMSRPPQEDRHESDAGDSPQEVVQDPPGAQPAAEADDQSTDSPTAVPAEESAEESVEEPAEMPLEVPADGSLEADAAPVSDEEPSVEETVAPPTEEAGGEPAPSAGATATPEPVAEPTTGPASPTVVTRSRRRSARRPAGPPAATTADPAPGELGSVGAPPESGAVEPGTAQTSEPPTVSHVPVKKRGSRKR